MGNYKKFEDTDILNNYLITAPYAEFISGSGNAFLSGVVRLYDEPFMDDGSAAYYIGFEEGDVRDTVEKYNPSGTILFHYISSSASGSERGMYGSVLGMLSGSEVYHNEFISGTSGSIGDKMIVLDWSSVFYDKSIKDCLVTFNIPTLNPKAGARIVRRDVGGSVELVVESGSMIIYHNGSGSLKAGSYKYVHRDDDGRWRYNISASMADVDTVGVYYGNGVTHNIDLNATIGYLLPEYGLGLITQHAAISSSLFLTRRLAPLTLSYTFMSFTGYHEVPVNTFLCSADNGELNYSNNATYYRTGTAGEMYHSGSSTTYVTHVGLYNNERKLVAVASLAQPIRKRPSEKVLFKFTIHR